MTDGTGKLYQHMEYFPFGESWVDERSNTQRTPYLFTAKEMDEETGLQYFGARYYDPRTSVWQSPDPMLARYMSGSPNGGIFGSVNLGVYTYSFQNPVKYVDPDGRYGIVGHMHTPMMAALAAGLPANLASELGRAAWAPDADLNGKTDPRNAMSWTSFFQVSGWNRIMIHLLNSKDSKEVQAKAIEESKAVIMAAALAPNKEIDEKGENKLHGLGDAFAHQNGKNQFHYFFGHLWASITGREPDNPHTKPDAYLSYAGTVYDSMRAAAEQKGSPMRMSREEFLDGMRNLSKLETEAEQLEFAKDFAEKIKARQTE